MTRSRGLCLIVSFMAVVLLGTVVVLSTAVIFFGVDKHDLITEPEMLYYEQLVLQQNQLNLSQQDQLSKELIPPSEHFESSLEHAESLINNQESMSAHGNSLRKRSSEFESQPRIPKIVHQTWKVDSLPDRWEHVRQNCMQLHPDYEYKLWSDESARAFLLAEYPWFISTFDNYPYPIQRADAIRYFVLHHYGGIYMDLDVGCQRSMDPLLYFSVILPATIPVGVSNDLMLSEKDHPFMELVIRSLIPFARQYGTNYPTVMFSTGPMFLSAQYGRWPKSKDFLSDVRILPRRWYGKNTPLEERADAYFAHFYGSSWHSNDAWLITFLGKFGIALMYSAFVLVILGAARLIWAKRALLPSPPRLVPVIIPYAFAPESLPFTRTTSTPGKVTTSTQSHRAHGLHLLSPRAWINYLTSRLVVNSDHDALPQHSRPSSPILWRSSTEVKSDNRYRPIPSISRPPSPNQHEYSANGDAMRAIQSMSTLDHNHSRQGSVSPPPGATSSLLHQPAPMLPAAVTSWGASLFRPQSFEKPKRDPSTRTTFTPGLAPITISASSNKVEVPDGYNLPSPESSFRWPLRRYAPPGADVSSPLPEPLPSPRPFPIQQQRHQSERIEPSRPMMCERQMSDERRGVLFERERVTLEVGRLLRELTPEDDCRQLQ